MYLVTGAAGFYGIHAVKLLLERELRVLAVGTSPFPKEVYRYFTSEEQARLTFARCDVTNRDQVNEVFVNYPIQVVIHAAVVTILGDEEVGNERRITEVNALGTLNLLEAARSRGVERFVYISSSGVYGDYGHGVAPVHETVPVYPGITSMYCACKVFSEMLCQNFHDHGAFQVAIARIGSPYGPWERPTRSRKGMSLIYRLVELGMRQKRVRVFGRDVVRDWTHMRDIARGTVLLATCPAEQLRHTLYNVAGGVVSSIEHVAQKLEELILGSTYQFVDNPQDADLVAVIPYARGPLDISRVREDVGFDPEFTIDSGLKDYVHWWRAFRGEGGW